MLNKMELVCFSATGHPESAKEFYQNILGLRLIDDSPFALVFDVNGIMLRIQKIPDYVPPTYTILGWKVTDIESAIRELTSKGVHFEHYEGMPQDEVGIWKSPSGAKVAWFHDPDGNTLSLTQ